MAVDIIAYTNLVSLKFWARTKEYWTILSVPSRRKWHMKAIELTQEAWKAATANTDAKMPENYDDFKFVTKTYPDGVYSSKMLYATYSKKCVNTWNPVAVKQILSTLMEEYKLRDTGEW